MLKEKGYQESTIGKIVSRITDNHSLSQPQQQPQAFEIQEDEIRMSINLPYVKGTCEKTATYTQNSQDQIHFLH